MHRNVPHFKVSGVQRKVEGSIVTVVLSFSTCQDFVSFKCSKKAGCFVVICKKVGYVSCFVWAHSSVGVTVAVYEVTHHLKSRA